MQPMKHSHRHRFATLARLGLILALLSGLLAAPATPAAATTAADAAAPLISPATLLNPDGTLRLDGSFSGALDLDGWQVRMDPRARAALCARRQ